MPIYEYRCPKGHTFERFQSMTAPTPEKCDVCDASPIEIVLYPVAVHYKGSGFYSTDYGKGKAAKKDGGSESGGSESGGSSSGDSGGSSSTDSGGPSGGDSSSGDSKKSDSKTSTSDSSSSKPEKKS